VISKAIIIAYREDVTDLVSSLTAEGFTVELLRAEYTSEEMNYSKNSKTFLSHRKAWKKAAETLDYTLICEADFVPCRGIGDFEVFWPLENRYAWGYLYQGSPRLFALVGPKQYLRGHAAPLVSYAINASVASLMLKYFEVEKATYDLRTYFTFDSHLQWHVMSLGGEAFMPRYHYGEHGGRPNPEHATMGRLGRDGFHRADNLMSTLHFLPPYAEGSYVSFLRTRLEAHLLGLARLATGRWISRTNVYRLRPLDVVKMYLIGLRRLISLPL
jgi:hypothetical protein